MSETVLASFSSAQSANRWAVIRAEHNAEPQTGKLCANCLIAEKEAEKQAQRRLP